VLAHSRATSARLLGAVGLLAVLAASANAQQTGNISGTVRAGGGPVVNARAVLDTTREARSDSTGRFQFRDVVAGRHTLSVFAIGATPYSVNVIVAPRDTLDFEVVLVKFVVLDSVLVEGSTVRRVFAREFEDRKRVGLGQFYDSTYVKSFARLGQALSFGRGIRYKNDTVYFSNTVGTNCRPNVWIDKVAYGDDPDAVKMLRPDDIAGVEMYTRALLIPDEFRPRGRDTGCGALVIWTKRFWPQGRGK
jgi:hypothetical protein